MQGYAIAIARLTPTAKALAVATVIAMAHSQLGFSAEAIENLVDLAT